jgi:hypothetical protein
MRSRKPRGGTKGRSFKSRKDKMEEHVRTVHLQGTKKRKSDQEVKEDKEEENN